MIGVALFLAAQAVATPPMAKCGRSYDVAACTRAWSKFHTTFMALRECRASVARKYDLSHGQRPAAFQQEFLAKCDHVTCWSEHLAARALLSSTPALNWKAQELVERDKDSRQTCYIDGN